MTTRDDLVARLRVDASDGGQPYHPYTKWRGAHWRLVSLVELGVDELDDELAPQLDRVLDWLSNPSHRRVPVIDGRARRCASQEGNALWVACRLGRAHDPRVAQMAEDLVRWQWPDGGWNCDRSPEASHSSFHESLLPIRGLHAYHEATGEDTASDAARRAARFFLDHAIIRSHTTGEVADPQYLKLKWPPYWHHDLLVGLRIVAEVEPDLEGASRALDDLESLRGDDGTWRVSGRKWWRAPDSGGSGVEAVDWTPVADDIVTAQATAVLRGAGRDV